MVDDIYMKKGMYGYLGEGMLLWIFDLGLIILFCLCEYLLDIVVIYNILY